MVAHISLGRAESIKVLNRQLFKLPVLEFGILECGKDMAKIRTEIKRNVNVCELLGQITTICSYLASNLRRVFFSVVGYEVNLFCL